MTNKEQELRQERTEAAKRMAEILDKAEDEKRSMSDDEKAEYDKLNTRLDQIKDYLERKAVVGEIEERGKEVVEKIEKVNIGGRHSYDKEKEFKNIGEFLYVIADDPKGVSDKRLREMREQQMGTGKLGGFALPDQFKPDVLQVSPQEAIVRPRATVIPAGDPPDAKLTMPALDQTSAENIYGGVIITHTGEAITMTETDMSLKEVSLEPKEMTAYIVVTDKLLNNWDACSGFINGQLKKAMVGQEDYDFMRGDGINKALGFINSACQISATRSGASAVAYTDVVSMLARAKQGGNLMWIASQTTIPQLAAMVDAGSHAVWIGGVGSYGAAQAAIPSTLLGYPLLFADRLPALGTKGDICLVDLSYYLVKDGSGPFVALSTELLFLSNRTVFKIRWNVDAKPWLTEAIGLEGSTTNTVSPFVTLS